METWLSNFALENVWCNPALDDSMIIQPRRVSPCEGDVCVVKVSQHQINLPNKDSWFHVYQIGLLAHDRVGIDNPWAGWASAEKLVNTHGIIIQAYDERGRTLPLSLVYLRILSNGNFLVAVQFYTGQASFFDSQLYIRFHGGYFRKSPDYDEAHRTFSQSRVVTSGEDLVSFIFDYQRANQLPGYTFAYVNGYPVKTLDMTTAKVWDYLEFVHDGSVKEIYEFKVGNLLTFTSTLDKNRKYILHPPKKFDEINHITDVELQIYEGASGRFYNTHRTQDLRQLTHRDYSIPTDNVLRYATAEGWKSVADLTLRVFIRHSGMSRPVMFESNRIAELYKMNDSGIIAAMTGINSTVDVWKAANLEKAAYVRLMSAQFQNVNRDLATEAFGYNAVTKYAGDTPQKVIFDGTSRYVELPALYRRACTVYEYDADGLLLGYQVWTSASDQSTYTCKYSNTEMVEVIEGVGSDTLDINFNAANYVFEDGFNYRVYLQTLEAGVPTGAFEDITGSNLYTKGEGGAAVWSNEVDLTRRRPAIWKDSTFLTYSLTEDGYDGLIKFSLQTKRNDQAGLWPLAFCPEYLDIWMNGRALIQGLDYYCKWPQVIICNKEYLYANADYHTPKIVVRCRNQAAALEVPNYGYCVNGLLSHNDRFDVRDDKVIRISIKGSVKDRGVFTFREDAAVAVDQSLNGYPYVVEDPLIPLRTMVSKDSWAMRNAAVATDTAVEDYLTVKLPQSPKVIHNPIENKHVLVSPLINKLIHDLLNGQLQPVEDTTIDYIPTEQLDAILQPYLYITDYDPVIRGVDLRYVEVQPHDGVTTVELSELQYSIIERANDLYLNNEVVLNKLIKLKVKHG